MSTFLHLAVLLVPYVAAARPVARSTTLAAMGAALAGSLVLLARGPVDWPGPLVLDNLSLWLLPFACVVYLAILLCTPRAERNPAGRRALLWGLALDLTFFSVRSPLALALLWALTLLPARGQLTDARLRRIFDLYHGLGALLFALGALALPQSWAPWCLMLAIMLRKAVMPIHQWLPELFERGPLGHAIAFCAPQLGAYATLRLLSPTAPEGLLVALGAACLVTSVYGACLACGQKSVRGAYAGLFLGQSSLVFAGLQCTSEEGLAGGLCLWISGGLSLTGLGLAIWALEARRGPTRLDVLQGGFERSPVLATCFLIFGLSAVGFPGTLGFISEELLLSGTIEVYPHVGVLAAVAACLNGITVMRAYLSLFCGARGDPRLLAQRLRLRERVALLSLVALLLGFGLWPSPFVESRWQAARDVLEARQRHVAL